MKRFRLLFLLLLLLSAGKAFSQKYHIPGCPVDGCFYVDAANKQQQVERHANRWVDVVSDNNMVYASGNGKVIICFPHADKTYEIGIRYANCVITYVNVARKRVKAKDIVVAHMPIGELKLDPKDKHYHLGLQVVPASNPNEVLWGDRLASYLNAQVMTN